MTEKRVIRERVSNPQTIIKETTNKPQRVIRERVYTPEETGDSYPKVISKAIGTGLASIPDAAKILELPHKLIHGEEDSPAIQEVKQKFSKPQTINKEEPRWFDKFIGQGNPAVTFEEEPDLLDKFKKYIEPKADTAGKRIAKNAAEFVGGSIIPFGNAAKGASLLGKFAKAGKHTTAAATIGGTSGALQEGGVNPLAADIAASVAISSVSGIIRGADKTAAKLVGLGKKSIDLPAAEAARNLNIDLPAAALTDNKLTNFFDHANKKNPLGFYYKQKEQKIYNNIDNIIDDVIAKTGLPDTADSRKIVFDLYTEAGGLLPKDAKVYSKATHEASEKVKSDLTKSLINSDNEKKVIKAAVKIQNQIAPYNLKGVQTPIENLVATKRSLNDIIDWKAPSDVRSRVKTIQRGIKDDLATYGETNPAWYNKLLEADRTHGGIQRRLELEELLDKATNHAGGHKSNYKLSKAFNEPSKKSFIKKLTNKEDTSKIDDLGEITRAMYKHEKANPNPSGTATTTGFIKGITATPAKYLTGTGLGWAYSLLADNPNFINRAVDRAKGVKPNSTFFSDVSKRLPIIASRNSQD